MNRFGSKTICIVGLSVEGLDTVQYFLGQKAKIVCLDRRDEKELGEMYQTLKNNQIHFFLGKDYLKGLTEADIIVRTPGFHIKTKELHTAKEHGAEITSQTKLFFELCKAPIIGVTGTKGKGTTATLISEMLKRSGKNVYLGGNVGIPLLSKVEDITPSDWVVYELSSFQLLDLTISPHIAVVLKITEDHLKNFDPLATSYHETREEYVDAKRNIARFQKPTDFLVVNAGDPTSRSFSEVSQARVYEFSSTGNSSDAYVKQGIVHVTYQGETIPVCSRATVQLIGDHNLENIAAASITSFIAGATVEAVQKVSTTFPGLPYRLQDLGTHNGIRYINDSFSTTPETTIAAIRSFSEPILLILGGSEKGSDFTDMGKEIAQSTVKRVILIGEMTDRILRALEKACFAGTIEKGYVSMHEVMTHAVCDAIPGDVVLLSPACASFGMFRNYKERGKQFAYEVSQIISKT